MHETFNEGLRKDLFPRNLDNLAIDDSIVFRMYSNVSSSSSNNSASLPVGPSTLCGGGETRRNTVFILF